MAKDKERPNNPAAAQRKAEKQKALKKSKAVVAAQRNERLAHRNPERLEAQIAELEGQQSATGSLQPREVKILAGLQKDLDQILKAKQAVGQPQKYNADNKPRERDIGKHCQVLGKRPRFHHQSAESSETDEDVRLIPMPRDSPPLVPRKRQSAYTPQHKLHGSSTSGTIQTSSNTATAQSQLVYESQAVVRDLRKEALGLVPSAVKQKLNAIRGGPRQPLLTEPALARLEAEGYSLSPMSVGMKQTTFESEERNSSADNRERHARVEDVDTDS